MMLLCFAYVTLLGSLLPTLTSGVDRNVSVPEGLFVYPKTILKLDLTSIHTSRCYVNRTTTVLPNNTVISIKRKYFGVALDNQHVENQVVLVKREASIVVPSPVISTPSKGGNTVNITATKPFTVPSVAHTSAFGIRGRTVGTTSGDIIPRTAPSTAAVTETTGEAKRNESISSTHASSTISPTQVRMVELLQLRDLDRETHDNYILDIACVDGLDVQSETSKTIKVLVEDVNDNTPVFNASSLHVTISRDFKHGKVMQISATDRDVGLNAELRFRMIRGSQNNVYPSGSEKTFATLSSLLGPNAIVVDPEGAVYLFQSELVPEMVMTFSVVVKDRGDLSNGNRATATATVEVCCSGSTIVPSENSGKSKLEWWMIVVPVLGVVLACSGAVAFKYVRNKRRNTQSVLVIDDHFLLASDREESFPA